MALILYQPVLLPADESGRWPRYPDAVVSRPTNKPIKFILYDHIHNDIIPGRHKISVTVAFPK